MLEVFRVLPLRELTKVTPFVLLGERDCSRVLVLFIELSLRGVGMAPIDWFDLMEKVFTVLGGLATLWGIFFGIRAWLTSRVTWKFALKNAEAMLSKIEGDTWRPDVVVGLGRSGALWGGWLAGNLGSLPIVVFDRAFNSEKSVREFSWRCPDETIGLLKAAAGGGVKILAVEGASSSGKPFESFHNLLSAAWPESDIRFATLFTDSANPIKVDYIGTANLSPWPDRLPWHLRDVYRRFMRRS